MLHPSLQLFLFTLLAGLILIGVEIFVPGGLLGAIGGMLLLAAAILGFIVFPGAGIYVAAGILALAGIAIYLWVMVFPKTRFGKKLTVTQDLKTSKGTQDGIESLVGKTGITTSDLRPSGFAVFDGRCLDVLTLGEMIPKGEPIYVVKIESNSIVVARVQK